MQLTQQTTKKETYHPQTAFKNEKQAELETRKNISSSVVVTLS